MSHSTIFDIANALAFFSWVYLLIAPFKPTTNKVLMGVSVALLSVAYAVLVLQVLQPADFQKFQTLEGITSMLATPGASLVGWLHYLAFDLMVGLFIAHNAGLHGIRHAYIIPCLLLTFMLGPVGLLLYFIIRLAITRQWFANNF